MLCDVILKRPLDLIQIYRLSDQLAALERVFGKAKSETLDYYGSTLRKAGFAEVQTMDISDRCAPTVARWEENIHNHQRLILDSFKANRVGEFLAAIDILRTFFSENIVGYGLVKAIKLEEKTFGKSHETSEPLRSK